MSPCSASLYIRYYCRGALRMKILSCTAAGYGFVSRFIMHPAVLDSASRGSCHRHLSCTQALESDGEIPLVYNTTYTEAQRKLELSHLQSSTDRVFVRPCSLRQSKGDYTGLPPPAPNPYQAHILPRLVVSLLFSWDVMQLKFFFRYIS